MINFCSYFDRNYLTRGIALYDSIQKQLGNNFKLYVIAFDDFTYDFFKKKKNFKNIVCVHHKDFEDKELKKVKNQRSLVEYLWTCTPSIIIFFIKKYKLKQCTYLDADIYFFDNPKIVFSEHKNYSTSITSHNYTKKYDQTKTSGKYCVQFMIFNNDKNSIKTLNWWRKKCLEWCFNRVEKNKFGDQKYLDIWPKKFRKVKVISNLGVGVAPWNIQRFTILNTKKITISENKIKYPLVFFHYHGLRFFLNNKISFISSYEISTLAKNTIYKPHVNHLVAIAKRYSLNHGNFKFDFHYFKMIIKLIFNYKNLLFFR